MPLKWLLIRGIPNPLILISFQGSGVTSDFKSLKDKRIGYVGEFGKVC